MNDVVQKAVKVLNQGGIIIYPTDTAFGIGCRIDMKDAITRLFTIRRRPVSQATSILVDTVSMAQQYLLPLPKTIVDQLIEPFWPGALTIIYYAQTEKVPELVRGGSDTLGVRIPNHAVARAIIREVGVPILGPSANFHGNETPYSFEELDAQLVRLVDYVVNGTTKSKKASTVVDCTRKPWEIIRQGAVKLKI